MKKLFQLERRFLLMAALAMLVVTGVLLFGVRRFGPGGTLALFVVFGISAGAVVLLTRSGRGIGKKTRSKLLLVVTLAMGIPIIFSSVQVLTEGFNFFAAAAIVLFGWIIVSLLLELSGRRSLWGG